MSVNTQGMLHTADVCNISRKAPLPVRDHYSSCRLSAPFQDCTAILPVRTVRSPRIHCQTRSLTGRCSNPRHCRTPPQGILLQPSAAVVECSGSIVVVAGYIE